MKVANDVGAEMLCPLPPDETQVPPSHDIGGKTLTSPHGGHAGTRATDSAILRPRLGWSLCLDCSFWFSYVKTDSQFTKQDEGEIYD